jgi:hypothetical protein
LWKLLEAETAIAESSPSARIEFRSTINHLDRLLLPFRTILYAVRRFRTFDEHISAYGGVVSRAELLLAGWSGDSIRFGVQHGALRRLCRGWYGSSDLPPEVRAAWAHGGPLACVSALEFLKVIDADGFASTPHVSRPSRGHRLRYTGNATIHWSDSAYGSGSRWCVSVETAFDQAARCDPGRLPQHEQERRTPPRWPGPVDAPD